jgi:WD40 repeat protein
VSEIVLLNNETFAIGAGKEISIWNFMTRAQMQRINAHARHVLTVAKIRDDLLVSGSIDTLVKIWNYKSGHLLKNLSQHNERVNCVISFHNESIASCSHDKTILSGTLVMEKF